MQPTDEDRQRARDWLQRKSIAAVIEDLAYLIVNVRRETAEAIAKEIEAAFKRAPGGLGALICIPECAAIARKHAKRGES